MRLSPIILESSACLLRIFPEFMAISLSVRVPSFRSSLILASAVGTAKAAFSTTRPAPAMNYIDKLALVLVRDRKQLVARTRGKTAFFTPGGKREAGETDFEALSRECLEELSIKLKGDALKRYGTFEAQAYGKPEGTMIRLTCYGAAGEEKGDIFDGVLKASGEVEELRWIGSDCPKELLTATGIMLLEDLKEKDLVD